MSGLLVLDLGLELPVALAVRAGGVDRIDRDDLLAGVTVSVEGDVAKDRLVRDVGLGRLGPDRLAKRGVVGRVTGGGPLEGVQDDLGAGVAHAGVAGGVDAVLGLVGV